jgi:hypothetical protein
VTKNMLAAILIPLFSLTTALPQKTAAQQSTGAQTMESRSNTSPSVQTMEMKNAPSAVCNVDEATVMPGQVLHVRVRTENVPENTKLLWSLDAGQIQAQGNEAVVDTSGLTMGDHKVEVRTSLQGRIVSCTVTFTVIAAPPPPPPPQGSR